MITFIKRQILVSLFILLMPSTWLLGYTFFYRHLPEEPLSVKKADAIVVLTGGRNRLKEGVLLLQRQKAPKLYISGVRENIKITHLLKGRNQAFYDKVTLSYEATNTRENAQDVASWTKKHGLKSIILVTNDYHMPRSLLETRRLLPDLTIYPYAVASHSLKYYRNEPLKAAYLIAEEYSKFLFVYAKYRLEALMKE